jgi:hypothetical protein
MTARIKTRYARLVPGIRSILPLTVGRRADSEAARASFSDPFPLGTELRTFVEVVYRVAMRSVFQMIVCPDYPGNARGLVTDSVT